METMAARRDRKDRWQTPAIPVALSGAKSSAWFSLLPPEGNGLAFVLDTLAGSGSEVAL
jgi:hypothetical protein